MRVHLINPSDVAFGIGVITPRWLYVIAAATPAKYGDPIITDETLEQFDPENDSARRCGRHWDPYRERIPRVPVGSPAAERGAIVIYGGIHASLYPDELTRISHQQVTKGLNQQPKHMYQNMF